MPLRKIRLRRQLAATTLVLAISLLAAAVPASAKVIIGIGEQRPTIFLDNDFQATKIKRVRVFVPWDGIARQGEELEYLDTWFGLAQASGVEPLVSFNASWQRPKQLPSVATLRRQFRAFRERYPWVTKWTTWNEANYTFRQPTGRSPKRTAQYYRMMRQECRRCTVLAGDYLANGTRPSIRWLRKFLRYLPKGKHIWGVHTYPDNNYFTTRRTRRFLREIRGRYRQIWITETGGVYRFAKVLKPSLKRQAKAVAWTFDKLPRLSGRIKRLYFYSWQAADNDKHWDSGLVNQRGQPRPAYRTFVRKLKSRKFIR